MALWGIVIEYAWRENSIIPAPTGTEWMTSNEASPPNRTSKKGVDKCSTERSHLSSPAFITCISNRSTVWTREQQANLQY